MTDLSSRRFFVALRRTNPFDRASILVLLLYLVARLASSLWRTLPFTSFLGFLALLAFIYLVIRALPWIRARLLWRLRNRLIVAYVFMVVVPAILLLTMVSVAGYLLELQIGAHLLRDDLQNHISSLATDTNAIAAVLNHEPGLPNLPQPPVGPPSPFGRGGRGGGRRGGRRGTQPSPGASPGTPPAEPPRPVTPEEEILSRPEIASVIAAARSDWPNMRVILNRGQDLLQTDKPSQFTNFIEFQGRLFLASAERLTVGDRMTVLVVAPVNQSLLNRLPAKLGPIRFTLLEPASSNAPGNLSFNGTSYVRQDNVASNTRVLSPRTNWFDFRIEGAATFQALKEEPDADPTPLPVLADFSFRVSDINRDLLTSVGELGPSLVIFLLVAGTIFIVLELAAFATGFMLTRTITSSVGELYDATLHVRRGDFAHRVRVRERDQLGSLGESFNEMTGSISELIEEQRQRQRLENEVSIAQEVQQHLFPTSVPSVPGLQISAVCRPARTVSGDYYDFVSLGPSRVGIALADISGKGIFAALLMASVQAALRSTAMLDPHFSSAQITSHLNEHLFKNTSDDRYATFFYGIYDSDAMTFTYTNAGHLAPFFVSDNGVEMLDCGGTVVGLFENAEYQQKVLKVTPGTVLVAYSDGLTEAENVYGEEFGTQRLKEAVLRQKKLPPQQLLDNLLTAADQWAGTPEQGDDITIVVARMG